MRLTEEAVNCLVGIITGDGKVTRYRSGAELVAFFNALGETDLYGQGFPSRYGYVREKITSLNGSVRMKDVVEAAFNLSFDEGEAAEDAAYQFTKIIAKSGFKLIKRPGDPFYWDGSYHHPSPTFQVAAHIASVPSPPTFLLDDETLNEYVSRARARIDLADYPGAITICYTLIECFLKLSLDDAGSPYNRDEGDIRKLYREYSKIFGMELSEATPDPLKPLLGGLTKLVGGFYEVANKAGDRHLRRFKPSAHHAKLVVSLTYTFCEFLVDSRRQREKLKLTA